MLDPAQRRRFARHLLLAEVGETGQARLGSTRVRVLAAADARAAAVARDYLERAGLLVLDASASDSVLDVRLPDRAGVRAIAGCPELEEAAAALAGAFAAVEAIKTVLAVGTRGELPVAAVFSAEAEP
jgi:hypothetical protein